jgi:hypothetical protein
MGGADQGKAASGRRLKNSLIASAVQPKNGDAMKRMKLQLALAATISMGLTSVPVNAQTATNYPTKPVRIIVGYQANCSGPFHRHLHTISLSLRYRMEVQTF